MKRRDVFIICGVLGICLLSVLAQGTLPYSTIEKLMNIVVSASSNDDAIKVEFANTTTDFTVSGTMTAADVTATDDIIATDDLTVGGWAMFAPVIVSAQSYTIKSTEKSAGYVVNYTDTGAATIFLPTGATNGMFLAVADGDLNAGTNNITVATEGSETINESATYVMNANGEAIELLYNSAATDWQIIGGYAE